MVRFGALAVAFSPFVCKRKMKKKKERKKDIHSNYRQHTFPHWMGAQAPDPKNIDVYKYAPPPFFSVFVHVSF